MAALSDHDKRILLGDDHLEAERQRIAASGYTAEMLKDKVFSDRLETVATTAIFFSVVSGLIFVSNWFSVASPYLPWVALVCGLVTVVALSLAIVAVRMRRGYGHVH